MKKWVIVVIIVFGVIVLGGSLVYMLIGDSGKDPRVLVRERFYDNQIEACENPLEEGFDSAEQCESVMECISLQFSQLVRSEDLESVALKMESEDAGKVISDYRSENPDIDTLMREKALLCLSA